MGKRSFFFSHPTSEISLDSKIGSGTKIWHFSQIREKVKIGKNCIFGKNVYVDFGVKIGNNCKIQNNCSIFHGVTVQNGVFIGPHVILTNDKYPRAINSDGSLKKPNNWNVGKITVKTGASIGAGSVILPNVTIGRYALIGAGSVVSKDVPDFALVLGNPAKIVGRVNKFGTRVATEREETE